MFHSKVWRARIVAALGSLALSACGSGDGSLGDSPTFSGQIDSYTQGAGFTLQAIIPTTTSPFTKIIAMAPIDASGNFSITLPGSATVTPYLFQQHYDGSTPPIKGCTATLMISPADFATTTVQFKAVNGNTTLTVTRSNGGAGTTASPGIGINYIYSDRELSENGQEACPANTLGTAAETINVAAHYKTGWNTIVISSVGDSNQQTLSESTGSEPGGMKWIAK
jgi:hypothetical protein